MRHVCAHCAWDAQPEGWWVEPSWVQCSYYTEQRVFFCMPLNDIQADLRWYD